MKDMPEEGETILVVEDNDITRYAIVEIINSAGFKTLEASTGREAMELMKEQPDLVVLDVGLPDTDGYTICRRIKENPVTSNIPVLHLSSTHKNPRAITRGMEAGADGYLTHPVEPDVLMAYIKSLLKMKKSKAEALETAREWNATFNAMTSGIIILTTDGMVKRANRVAREMLGKAGESMAGNSLKKLIGEWVSSSTVEIPLEDIVSLNKRSLTFRKDGRFYRRHIIPVKDEKKKTTSFIFVIIDETEVRLLEEQYRQAQKMEAIGRLTGGVAHDFNNMLTVIIGYADYLLATLDSSSIERNIVEQIKKAGLKATSLAQKLLAFSRKQAINPELIDINGELAEMEKILKRVLGEDIEIEMKLEDKLKKILFDRAQLEQVIMNIVVNARDAMPGGGRLTIETANAIFDDDYADRHSDTNIKRGEYVMLAISDTGTGIDKEIIPHIFEPFFTTKGKGEGTGLGLSTVYGIVKQNNGYIWVYSELGKGTTFKIYIPAAREGEEKKEETSDSIKSPRGNEKLLLVEDDKLVTEMLEKGLSDLGYKVTSLNSPGEALRLIDHNLPYFDMLITDVMMPGMNGKELADILKRKMPHLKVLFISGYTDSVIVKKNIIERGVDFLQKPFTPLQLAKKIRSILDR